MRHNEYNCEVKSRRALTPTVFEISFETDRPLEFKAGQFISVIIPGAGPNGRDLRRAYSIASPPEKHPIDLCVKLVEEGPGSEYLYRLLPGDIFRGVAPYGDFIYKPRVGRKICFVATGTGIAPFFSMVKSIHYQENPPTEAFLFFGVRTEEELLYQEAFKTVPKLHFVSTLSQPTDEHLLASKDLRRGRVTDYLRNLKGDFDWLSTEFYLCGHGGMIQEVKSFLTEMGVTKDSIHQEIYYK